MSVHQKVYELAESFLPNAPKRFIESLAQDVQRTCDAHAQEYEAWADEQRALTGATDRQLERF